MYKDLMDDSARTVLKEKMHRSILTEENTFAGFLAKEMKWKHEE